LAIAVRKHFQVLSTFAHWKQKTISKAGILVLLKCHNLLDAIKKWHPTGCSTNGASFCEKYGKPAEAIRSKEQLRKLTADQKGA